MIRERACGGAGLLWVEEGDARFGWIAEVAPVAHVRRTHPFAVPESLEGLVSLGRRVQIPLGRSRRLVSGFVVRLDRRPWDSSLAPIHAIVDAESYLTPDLIRLAEQIAGHYGARLGAVLQAMTPEAVRRERGLRTLRLVQLNSQDADVDARPRRLGPKQQAVLAVLRASTVPIPAAQLIEQSGASSAVLRSLERNGLITFYLQRQQDGPENPPPPLLEPDFELTDEQVTAVAAIRQRLDENAFGVTLLYGVSGSGKTEVYIRAIRHVLERGRQALLLVPEIMLTAQLVSRLESRLPHVALVHSGLTEVQRSILWRRAACADKKVVIGTRSAVFAPLPSLGLICVDEEQEASFKNLREPRFHVRDVAVMRAQQLGIPVVLGSATPSLEVWHNSRRRGDYHTVCLRRRPGTSFLPIVRIVDMRDEEAELGGPVLFSRLFNQWLASTLEQGEQALILMNRRGYARALFCPACRVRVSCPHCSVALVVHTTGGRTHCHYCRTMMETPTLCPTLGCGVKLTLVGAGTQRIEESLQTQFPFARIQRADSDTMKHRDDYPAVVHRFSAGELDILLGTQMIAKGLDFPGVTFVGIIDADPAGWASDFRSQERLFQLVAQTAGRAGRAGLKGRVVVQTRVPELPALRFALTHDYEAFAESELQLRERTGLPPFRRLARVLLSHPRDETARAAAETAAQRVRDVLESLLPAAVDVLGPTPCALHRLRGSYRYDFLIRAPDAAILRRLLIRIEEAGALRVKQAKVILDVDPVSLG